MPVWHCWTTGLSIDELMEHIQGPDFPTAGIINGRAGIVQAYRRPRPHLRARAGGSGGTQERP